MSTYKFVISKVEPMQYPGCIKDTTIYVTGYRESERKVMWTYGGVDKALKFDNERQAVSFLQLHKLDGKTIEKIKCK